MPAATAELDVDVSWEDIDDERLVLRAASGDGRTLTGYIVPWGQEARVQRPVAGLESFVRGALTRTIQDATAAGRAIPLLALHEERVPVGRLVTSHDDDFGQHATFRLFNTAPAQDTAELIREGIWRSFSVGGLGIPSRTAVTHGTDGVRRIVRREMILDHVAILRQPAYSAAAVEVLRGAQSLDSEALAAAVAERQARRAALLAVGSGS